MSNIICANSQLRIAILILQKLTASFVCSLQRQKEDSIQIFYIFGNSADAESFVHVNINRRGWSVPGQENRRRLPCNPSLLPAEYSPEGKTSFHQMKNGYEFIKAVILDFSGIPAPCVTSLLLFNVQFNFWTELLQSWISSTVAVNSSKILWL